MPPELIPAAPVAAPVEPVVATPVAAPAAEAAPVAAAPVVPAEPVTAAPAAPAAPVEAAPVEAAPVELIPAETPSLLEEIGKKPAAAASDKGEKPADAALDKDGKPVEPPAAEPAKVEWELALPETLRADDAVLGKFRDNLQALLSPKEGETPSHAAQRLLDMHAEQMATYDKQLRADQVRIWNDTRKQWRTESMADPLIGGSGHQTALGVVGRVRDAIMSDARPGTPQFARDEKSFNEMLRLTGMGDHPVFLRALYRAGRFIDEAPQPRPGAQPPPDLGRKPGRRSLYSDDAPAPR